MGDKIETVLEARHLVPGSSRDLLLCKRHPQCSGLNKICSFSWLCGSGLCPFSRKGTVLLRYLFDWVSHSTWSFRAGRLGIQRV